MQEDYHMKLFASFLITVAAGVACHCIIKRLNGDGKSNKSPGRYFATIKVKKNPRTVQEHGSGISFFVHMELLHLFLPKGTIAYANFNCKIHF